MLFLLFASCGPGIIDVTENLPNDFVYRQDGTSNYLYVNSKVGVKEIYPQIKKIVFDEEFILIEQIPNKDYLKNTIVNDRIFNSFVSPKNIDSILKTVNEDSILNHDLKYKKIFKNKVNYWILRIKDKKFFGPYALQNYYKRKMELGVSKNLILVKEN